MSRALTKEDKVIMEDLLSELLYVALICAPHIRNSMINICEGLAEQLDPKNVERCMDYSRFRKDEYAKTLPGYLPPL